MKVKLGDLTKIRTGKLDANASSPNGKYPFLLALKNRCASIAIHMIVSVFLLLETVT